METQLQSLISFAKTNPVLSTASAGTILLASIAFWDYRYYVSMGPHGLLDTFWGWYTQLKWTLKARKDVLVPAPYDLNTVAGPHDRTSFLPKSAGQALRPRPGPVPKIPGYVAPQRQITDIATPEMKRRMHAHLESVAAKHSSHLQIQDSLVEGPVPGAMGVKNFANLEVKPDVLARTRGEMCHIHPPDGTVHLIISLVDQKKVIELGWGRRHRMSGTLVPWNYTLVYAPRDEEDFEVWKVIVEAAAKFACTYLE